LSFDFGDYLNLAEALVNERGRLATEEACLRSAVSRAYYSVFILARDFTATKEEEIADFDSKGKKLGSHERIIEHFKNSCDARRQKIGLSLDRLREFRVQADYYALMRNRHGGPLLLLPSANFSVSEAKTLLSAIRSLP